MPAGDIYGLSEIGMKTNGAIDSDKRKLMKRLGLTTAVGGFGLSSSTPLGFSPTSTSEDTTPSIDDIAIETAKHPSEPLIAYTSNAYSGGYIGLYLSKNTTSTSESPNDPSVLANPTKYGVWGLEWTDETSLEYQYGLVTQTAVVGDTDLLQTRTTQQRGREELLEGDGMYTAGTLPAPFRDMINNLKDIRVTDPATISDRYETSISSPSLHPKSAYCTRRLPKPRKGSGGGGSGSDDDGGDDDTGDDSGSWQGGGRYCYIGGSGGGNNESDETTTTTTTTTTKITTTTSTTSQTTTTTYDVCDMAHELSMWVPNVRKALDGPWAFSNFTFDCDEKRRTLMTVPLLNKVFHYDCNGNTLEVNELTLWIGLDLKAIAEQRTDCPLFVGISEKFADGTVSESACTKFCDLGDKLMDAVTTGDVIENLRDVANDLSYWTEYNADIDVDSLVMEPLVLIGLIALLIIAVGIGVYLGPTVSFGAALYALALGLSMGSGAS